MNVKEFKNLQNWIVVILAIFGPVLACILHTSWYYGYGFFIIVAYYFSVFFYCFILVDVIIDYLEKKEVLN